MTSFQIFFYEWELSLKWKGHLNGNDKEVKGKVEICNLSEEHENMEDVDIVSWRQQLNQTNGIWPNPKNQ